MNGLFDQKLSSRDLAELDIEVAWDNFCDSVPAARELEIGDPGIFELVQIGFEAGYAKGVGVGMNYAKTRKGESNNAD